MRFGGPYNKDYIFLNLHGGPLLFGNYQIHLDLEPLGLLKQAQLAGGHQGVKQQDMSYSLNSLRGLCSRF